MSLPRRANAGARMQILVAASLFQATSASEVSTLYAALTAHRLREIGLRFSVQKIVCLPVPCYWLLIALAIQDIVSPLNVFEINNTC